MQMSEYPEGQQPQTLHYIPGPPQLPPLVRGQIIQSGPYNIKVTDEMVAQRERQNEELYRAWLNEQQRRAMHPNNGEDVYIGDFKDSDVRRVFILKVFCILTIQLMFAAAFIAFFVFVESAKKFMILYWYWWIIALISFMISYCAISCSDCARRQIPFNYICLSILTVAMSYLAAFASIFYSTEVILLTVGMTAFITLAIGLVATYSKLDLTMRSGLMAIFGFVSIVAILMMVIVLMFTYIKVLHLLISIIATLLLSMYLYFDIQTIMGGRRLEISPNEVVFATAQIFIDVILLYQYLLIFMGLFRDG